MMMLTSDIKKEEGDLFDSSLASLPPSDDHEVIDVDADPAATVDPPVPKKKRAKVSVGSRSQNEAKNLAVEDMNKVGAMCSAKIGHNNYECKLAKTGNGCKAHCRLKENAGAWTLIWTEQHKEGCGAIGAQPAFMQHSAVKYIKDHRSLTRTELQGHEKVKAISGNAFGQSRIYKALQRGREGCRRVHNLASLQSMVAASKELCVEQNDVATGYRSWGAPGAIDVDLRLGDWDANADIPGPERDEPESDAEITLQEAIPVSETLDESDPIVVSDGSDIEDSANPTQDHAPVPVVLPNSVSVLTSRRALLCLLQNSRLMRNIDGTFEMAPRDSCLMTVGYLEKGVHMPVAYAIATSKGCKSYESAAHATAVFECISDAAKELLDLAGETAWKDFTGKFMRDGGKGYNKAIREYFTGCQQGMCFFHLMQAIHRRQKDFPRVYDRVVAALRALNLVTDVTEFAIGLDLLLGDMRRSAQGRVFVRYWGNTQFGLGRCDGNWSHCHHSDGGDQTTNNGLECFNRVMKDMTGSRKKASLLLCVHKVLTVISTVTKRQETRIENKPERTIWTESHLAEELRIFNAARFEGTELHSSMIQTHSFDEVHVLKRGGLGIEKEEYEAMRQNRVRSFADWLAFADLRHTSSDKCTCKIFLHWKTCKHSCSLQILNAPDGTTPVRPMQSAHVRAARAPTKREREIAGVWQVALVDVTNRRPQKQIKKEV